MGLVRAALDAAAKMRRSSSSTSTASRPPGSSWFSLPTSPTSSSRCRSTRPSAFSPSTSRRSGRRSSAGTELRSFEQDADGVTSSCPGPGGEETVRARYLVGCDGAHSAVRKGWGSRFEGGAFPEEYMLGDVVVDWSCPHGYGLRSCTTPTTAPRMSWSAFRSRARALPDDDGRPTGARNTSRGGRTRSSTASRPEGRRRASPTSSPSSTGSRPSPPPPESFAGLRSSGSATGSSTGTRRGGPSSLATPRTSTRRPAPRA